MDGMMGGVMKGALSDSCFYSRLEDLAGLQEVMHIAYKSNSICMQYVQTKDFSCEYQVFRLDVRAS